MQKSVGSPSWLREGRAAVENVNLWLRWPEAGMLRTASHSESEAAERTVRPWILWTLLRWLSKARRGTVFYSLSPPSFSLSALLHYVFSVPPGIFLLMFQIFPHSFSVSPCFSQNLTTLHQTSSPVLFLSASTVSVAQAWFLLQED